jgi:hypothetical protein
MQLDEVAALESASWGLGQVMWFNAQKAGYSNVETMITAMVASEASQIQAVARFVMGNRPLLAAFQAKAWAKMAFFYNGAGFAKNHYDLHLENYHQIYSVSANLPDIELRTAQVCLTYLGFSPQGVDGVMGSRTRTALLAYRRARGLGPGGLDAQVLQQLVTEANV